MFVQICSDLETMLISRYVTLALVPIGWLASAAGYLPITLTHSILGTLTTSTVLWIVATLFHRLRRQEGLGQGDIDLIAFIGSFLGVFGAWITLCIGAFLGSLYGLLCIVFYGRAFQTTQIPFGPFLALGAYIALFWQEYIITMLQSA